MPQATAEKPNSREQQLADFLHSVNARCLWQQRIPRVGMMEALISGAQVFYVLRYSRGDGFELLAPVCTVNSTALTFAAMRDFLERAAAQVGA